MIETSGSRIPAGRLVKAALVVVLALVMLFNCAGGNGHSGYRHMKTATGGDCSAIWVDGEWFCP